MTQQKFGGEGVVNARVKAAKAEEWDEREYSIKVKLPALGVSIYSCTPGKAPAKRVIASKTAKTTKKVTTSKAAKTTKKVTTSKAAKTTKKATNTK